LIINVVVWLFIYTSGMTYQGNCGFFVCETMSRLFYNMVILMESGTVKLIP
jgi:hypothetical protein